MSEAFDHLLLIFANNEFQIREYSECLDLAARFLVQLQQRSGAREQYQSLLGHVRSLLKDTDDEIRLKMLRISDDFALPRSYEVDGDPSLLYPALLRQIIADLGISE